MRPAIIYGGAHNDVRGALLFNNSFDAGPVKRIYTIAHNDETFVRGWIGHEIEHRWFTVLSGSFRITVLPVTDWHQPDLNPSQALSFDLDAVQLDVLHIPPGHLFSLQATAVDARILVMADRAMGAESDEHRFPVG
ncbi:cupin domain-containing protein [Niabella soli]|uniref:Sugar epimerase n=1 Tax=Niabella soli DSM 19437 TaxID=929713 RepID=W0F365_9BACT|nr:WxcM-like domain-containing protein [Niabella soli]AHF15746.1 sugar epimerase [Niabella soli DSM 19437]